MKNDGFRLSTCALRLGPLALCLPLGITTALLAQASDSGNNGSSGTAANTTPSYAERITVTATGEEASVEKLPVSVTVLTREEIDNAQEETVVDLVRRVPGVTVMRTGDRGGATAFFLRGTEADHVLALFDGVRLNSPYFAGYDFSTLSSSGVERIEVARGPFSALWGSDAVGGVVNVIPGRGTQGARALLAGETGDDDWQRLDGMFGWGDGIWDVYGAAGGRDGKGSLPNSDFSNRQLLLDAGRSFSSGRIAFLYQDLDAELGLPFSSPGLLTPNRRQDTSDTLFALPLSLQPTARWGLELNPSRVERDLRFRDPDDPFGFTSSDTLADTTQLRLNSHHDLTDDHAHALSWGGEWREDRVDAASSFGIDLDHEVVHLTGVFAQDVWRASGRLTVIGGLRYDTTDEWGSELSPKLSVGFEASQRLELRASYGEAFRQPSVGELFFPFSGNPDLEPERSKSAEVGLALRSGRQRFDIAAFATNTDDLIDFDLVTFTNRNIDRVTIRGAELSWSTPLVQSLTSSAQATWLDTEDQDGQELVRRPAWSASWTLDGHIGGRLRGDLALYYVGARDDIDAVTFGRTRQPSYTTADLALAYRMIAGLEITARVQNLADRNYQEVNGYPAAGRRFIVGLRWSPRN